jgi:hypothetical protein
MSRGLSVLGVALAVAGMVAQRPADRALDTMIQLETTSEDSANVSMGDLDGDGDLDVITSNDTPDTSLCT